MVVAESVPFVISPGGTPADVEPAVCGSRVTNSLDALSRNTDNRAYSFVLSPLRPLEAHKSLRHSEELASSGDSTYGS